MTTMNATTAVRIMRAPRKQRANWLFVASAAVLATVILAAICATYVAPYDPGAVDFTAFNAGPSAAHWLGTDGLGRDLLSRMIFGARTALMGPALVVVFSTVFGILLGLIAGWRGGWVDAVISRLFDVVFAFPSLLIAIMAVALFGKGLTAPIIAMSLAYVPYVARLTRQLVSAERHRPYVAAYRVQCFSGAWIALRRVLPNIFPVVGAQSTLNFGYVLAELAGLSFLGLGVQAPMSDWGSMINEAQPGLVGGHFLPALIPAVAVVIVVVAVNIIGEELSERIGGGIS